MLSLQITVHISSPAKSANFIGNYYNNRPLFGIAICIAIHFQIDFPLFMESFNLHDDVRVDFVQIPDYSNFQLAKF